MTQPRSFSEAVRFVQAMGETIAWPGERARQPAYRYLATKAGQEAYLDYLQGGPVPHGFAEPGEGEERFERKEEVWQALSSLAESTREPGESFAQSLDRYVASDPLGKELMGIYSDWPTDARAEAQAFAESRPARRTLAGEEEAFWAETDSPARQFIEAGATPEMARAKVWERYPKLMARGLRLGI